MPGGVGVLVIVLAVLTCLSILASTVGVWAHRTLLNTDSWVNAVGPLAENPEITDAVAKRLTDELMQMIDSSELAQNALPAQAQVLVAPLSEAVGQFVQRAVGELLQTDQFQEFWVAGQPPGARAGGEGAAGRDGQGAHGQRDVQLNLLPLIADAFGFVQSKAPGIFGNGTTVPDITFDTPVDQARSELQAASKRTLPDDFGVVTVFESDKLKAAQDAVSLFDKVVIALLVVTVLLVGRHDRAGLRPAAHHHRPGPRLGGRLRRRRRDPEDREGPGARPHRRSHHPARPRARRSRRSSCDWTGSSTPWSRSGWPWR